MIWPDQRPLRILVIRYRFIGDTLLAIPTLRNLRHAFPQAKIDVLVEPVSGDTLTLCPYKDELLYYAPRHKRGPRPAYPTSLWAAARMLRKRRYDRCYVLRRSLSGAFLALLAGIPHRVGFSTEGGAWLLQRSTPYPEKHEVECFLDVLRADGIPIRDVHNENWTEPAVDNEVDRVLPSLGRKPVFLCTKPSIVAKEWRPERFAAVAAWLIAERNCEIHVCDAPANAAYYTSIRDLLPSALQLHWHDWSTRLRLQQLPSLLRRMAVYFGVDTGLTHLAASLHVPVIVMFEPWMSQRWSPWDTRQELLLGTVPAAGTAALDSVRVEDVCAAFDRISASDPHR